MCWSHLLQIKHLRVKNSLIPNAGKGLFALNKKLPDNNVIFRRGDLILDYGGEILDTEQIVDRYDDRTAPYAIQLKHNVFFDCACKRDAGAIANQGANNAQNNARFSANYRIHPQQVQLRALRDIRNNTEILVNYGGDYHFNDGSSHTTSYVR